MLFIPFTAFSWSCEGRLGSMITQMWQLQSDCLLFQVSKAESVEWFCVCKQCVFEWQACLCSLFVVLSPVSRQLQCWFRLRPVSWRYERHVRHWLLAKPINLNTHSLSKINSTIKIWKLSIKISPKQSQWFGDAREPSLLSTQWESLRTWIP